MSFSIVIPVRPPGEGKSRLAPALDERARAALVERMFRHVLRVATQVVPPVQCHVVSRSPLLLDLAAAGGARAIRETGSGLNAALRQASALVDPALPLLALSADLPLLAPADLAALAEMLDTADVTAATDRAGIGTNALLLRRPGLIDYSFGADSLALHRARAMASGLRFTVMRREGLSADLDEPRDLALLARPSLSAA
ncbi:MULTISPECIES: 2-phospho-L-lactate guanylyltransferase [unclassified Sphingomonas]|uniref:2-phospho-L-lactate guanylyltransferase n=1 Tax=unclassified Sphingomonas TaxID=196159 RepID=UPI00092728F5|nr:MULTISPECIES: 2-phospho-L-lactate guanylyltransferase [unclassified Sphingomonas]MBN8848942.1 2-phospho-L-lactate guanylyltransferase [Sphingomonas sp.]OJV34406.1 MAG: 2-phospho-L-lactate guanylyltransferase [Sphingomonas sp. 67-36]